MWKIQCIDWLREQYIFVIKANTGISNMHFSITVAALCNAHGQCDQIFVKVGDGRLRQFEKK